MIPDIVHTATYAHPPELVWRALTTQDALRAWLMENDFEEPRVGHRFVFKMKKGMDRGWKMMLERAIPAVLAALAAGRTPAREAAKAAARH